MSILIGKPQHASSFVFSPWENKPPPSSTWLYVLDAEWMRNHVTKVTAITRTCQKSQKQVQLMRKYLWPRERTSHVFLWEKFIHWHVCMFMCVWVQSEARGQSRVSFLRCRLLCFVKQCLFLASNSPSRQGWLATKTLGSAVSAFLSAETTDGYHHIWLFFGVMYKDSDSGPWICMQTLYGWAIAPVHSFLLLL